MSTRAAVARPTRDGWAGRYHHDDGYPSGLGKALWNHRRDSFQGSVEEMVRILLDEHPAGWSTVVDKSFHEAPGFENKLGGIRAQCLCHGDRHQEDLLLAEHDSGDAEYAYVILPDRLRILVDTAEGWTTLAEVEWNGPEPKWSDLDARGSDLADD